MNDQLDHAVRGALADIVSTAPERDDQPIRSVAIGSPDRARRRPSLMIAAAVLVAVGVGGVAIVNNRDAATVPSATPPSAPVTSITGVSESIPVEAQSASPRAQLVSTALAGDSAPLVVPGGAGWELTHAYGWSGPPITGGFEGATVIVGEGPTYDAPLFAATVVDATSPSDGTAVTVPLIDTLLAEGEPVQVAGTTGAVTVTESDGDTGLPGPIVTIFWPLDVNRFARVNAVRLTVDEVVALADQLQLDAGRFALSVPPGYRELTVPAPGARRHIDYVFASGDRSLELIGENRGVASLLGRVAGEVRTTRVVDGVEVAYRPRSAAPGEYWADWQSGDWSFYVIASGYASEDEFFSELAALTLTDAATFEAAGAKIALVMPGVHNGLAGRALSAVGLSEAAYADAATTELAMSADSYGFELVQGAACVWSERWVDAGDTSAQQSLATDIQRTIAANTGTEFERAATLILTPLLDAVNGGHPETENSDGCPGWAAVG